jgi:hypothetical protein
MRGLLRDYFKCLLETGSHAVPVSFCGGRTKKKGAVMTVWNCECGIVWVNWEKMHEHREKTQHKVTAKIVKGEGEMRSAESLRQRVSAGLKRTDW